MGGICFSDPELMNERIFLPADALLHAPVGILQEIHRTQQGTT